LQNGEGEEPKFWRFVRAASTGKLFDPDLNFDFSRAFLKLFDWLLFLGCLAIWITFAFMAETDWWWTGMLPLCIAITGLAMLGNFIRWRRRTHRRATIGYGFRLTQKSLWFWLVTASTLYVAILLLALPLRQQADASLDRYLGAVTAMSTRFP
jgi:hypothetical protein